MDEHLIVHSLNSVLVRVLEHLLYIRLEGPQYELEKRTSDR